MGRTNAFLTSLCILLLAGCATRRDSGVRPEPLRFDHPDEVVEGDGFLVLADRRLFAAMAFLNAAGYDDELEGHAMHPVRVRVRQELEKRLAERPDKREAYRAYYREVILKRAPLFAYKSYVLSLSGDYPFRRIRPDTELGYPYTAEALKDLPRWLNDFWDTVGLEEVWEQVKPDYVAEINRYKLGKMKRQMAFLWEYLRMERSDPFTIVQVPDLLNRHLGAIGAGYGAYYYCVDNPGSHAYDLNVHEYLHSVVNPLVKANYAAFQGKLDGYYRAGRDMPDVRHYRHPVTFAYECMVGALTRRISIRFENDAKWTRLWESQVAHDTKEGLNLTQPFYDLLAEYEGSDKPFDEFLPILLARLPEHGP